MTQSALILIDIQNDYFPDGLMPLPNMPAAAKQAARLLAGARAAGDVVIHIQHIAASASAPFFRPDTDGRAIHPSVRPQPHETVISKARPNSFQGTDLARVLKGKGVTHLTMCGAMSQMCVDATARAAVDLGFEVTVISDACAAADVSFDGTDVPAAMVHAAIMAPLAASYARVVTLAQLGHSSVHEGGV